MEANNNVPKKLKRKFSSLKKKLTESIAASDGLDPLSLTEALSEIDEFLDSAKSRSRDDIQIAYLTLGTKLSGALSERIELNNKNEANFERDFQIGRILVAFLELSFDGPDYVTPLSNVLDSVFKQLRYIRYNGNVAPSPATNRLINTLQAGILKSISAMAPVNHLLNPNYNLSSYIDRIGANDDLLGWLEQNPTQKSRFNGAITQAIRTSFPILHAVVNEKAQKNEPGSFAAKAFSERYEIDKLLSSRWAPTEREFRQGPYFDKRAWYKHIIPKATLTELLGYMSSFLGRDDELYDLAKTSVPKALLAGWNMPSAAGGNLPNIVSHVFIHLQGDTHRLKPQLVNALWGYEGRDSRQVKKAVLIGIAEHYRSWRADVNAHYYESIQLAKLQSEKARLPFGKRRRLETAIKNAGPLLITDSWRQASEEQRERMAKRLFKIFNKSMGFYILRPAILELSKALEPDIVKAVIRRIRRLPEPGQGSGQA